MTEQFFNLRRNGFLITTVRVTAKTSPSATAGRLARLFLKVGAPGTTVHPIMGSTDGISAVNLRGA